MPVQLTQPQTNGSTLAVAPSDGELIERTRAGDDRAFAELYRRYQPRIGAFVRRLLRDDARAEDVTQEVFLSALRRLRATDSEILFKPWVYEIARNAAIDAHRRRTRVREVSISEDDSLSTSDRRRLSIPDAPDAALRDKQRLEHLRGALEELPDAHHRILLLRELEGRSYREIGQRMELSRPAVESALFRARRRLEHEYEELHTGRRCRAMWALAARLAEGVEEDRDRHARVLRRHARRCTSCRHRVRQLELDLSPARRAAAFALLPGFLRRPLTRLAAGAAARHGSPSGSLGPLEALGPKAAAIATAAALAGAGGAAVGHLGPFASHSSRGAAATPHKASAPLQRGGRDRGTPFGHGSRRGGAPRSRSTHHSGAAGRSRGPKSRGTGAPSGSGVGGSSPSDGGSTTPSPSSAKGVLDAVPTPQLPSGGGSRVSGAAPDVTSATHAVGGAASSPSTASTLDQATNAVRRATSPVTDALRGAGGSSP